MLGYIDRRRHLGAQRVSIERTGRVEIGDDNGDMVETADL
jgi:hypothetical protein